MKIPRLAALARFHNLTILATLVIAAIGGALAHWAGLPLGWLMGSILTVAAAALAGIRPFGHPLQLWPRMRSVFVPIIGVAIGAGFTPEILQQAGHWWPSLLALCLFVPVVHYLCFRLTLRLGGLDPVTAFYGTVPGGLIEAVEMGSARGADIGMLTMLQFLRLILVIILVPLGFSLMAGHAVGSAGGATMGGEAAHGPGQIAVLLGAALVGALIGLRLRMPAALVTGPLLVSGLLHLTGLVEGAPPGWLIALTQVVIGASLGAGFAGLPRRALWTGLRLSVTNTGLVLAFAGLMAWALQLVQDQPPMAVFLAFAPGGIAEMSLIALSLQMGAVYVTAHHALRIVLSVAVARAMGARIVDTNVKGGRVLSPRPPTPPSSAG